MKDRDETEERLRQEVVNLKEDKIDLEAAAAGHLAVRGELCGGGARRRCQLV